MSKISKSWERTRDDTHSPAGVEELRKNVRYGLTRFYVGLAESMWRYDMDSPRFEDMRIMSRDTVPEKFLMNNGECVWFSDPLTEQIHCLPFVTDSGGVNMYGQPLGWFPIPVGWDDSRRGTNPVLDRIRNTRLTMENSVIMRNDLFGGSDRPYIDAMVSELVDNQMTMNQLQLLAKCPFVFNVTEDNIMSAKNFFLALSSDKPVIFTNAEGEKTVPQVEPSNVKIDTGLFELFDRFECQILTYLGFPCVPITKRAQQTVSEVQSNDSKVFTRRMERFDQRRKACERITEMFGVSIAVHSVVDEMAETTTDGTGSETEENGRSDMDDRNDRGKIVEREEEE